MEMAAMVFIERLRSWLRPMAGAPGERDHLPEVAALDEFRAAIDGGRPAEFATALLALARDGGVDARRAALDALGGASARWSGSPVGGIRPRSQCSRFAPPIG
ncbi:hypothetical protein Ahu01nite_000990 [Winogradskya humida]|uniref:HEAT repeat protein n=1 Tax=Winogradskya humida TaxID=113566 RepID=A0ABQ3ZEK3_9ACTN|nr:hypothetical protein Ahu01nite_000990 [Actinoplanes humidus]